jgi:Asp-tRNA(Asn)/Glu-tRNA(Gln) amidotransferase A subunit family amidase
MSEPLTIAAAAPLIRTGELTPSELLEQCLRRIDVYEPAVKAWAYLDRERARQEAAKATDEIKAGQYRGPLHGIPIGIKDIIDVYDMPTGCGSKLWANSYARQDATCVERLRQAGAIILGKTVTTAYAYLDPPVTRNPWNLDRTPGGSSSGSAAAVACGMCLAALGTQTGGSLIRPASYCGVCALKPTWGRVSVNGVLPLAPSLDHIGVMAKCVTDLALVYRVIGNLPPTDSDPFFQTGGSSELVTLPPPASPQLQTTHDFFPERTDADVLRTLETALNPHPDRVSRIVLPPAFGGITDAHYTVMACEAAEVHADRIGRHPEDYPPKITGLIEDGQRRSGLTLRQAERFRNAIRAAFQNAGFPVGLVIAAAPADAPKPETTGNAILNSPWSFLGLPVVSLPIGFSADGLPRAVQIVGSTDSEAALLRLAGWCETAFGSRDSAHRMPPVPTE